MSQIRSAALWVWDFVVGDARLVGGVVVAIVVTALLVATHRSALADAAGIVFFLLIVAAIAFSLWKEVTPVRS